MKFFIDSADIDEIREAMSMGMCDGVTTNPSLVAKTGKSFETVIGELVKTVPGPVSLEVTTVTYDEMMTQARELAEEARHHGRTAAADAVDAVLDEILARPEHEWSAGGLGAPSGQ